MKKLPVYFVLGFIVIFGFFLRVYKLDQIPAGFFCDEASIGYNAYSVLTTGKDEYGKPFPVFFESFGDYRSPIEIYTTVPFIAIFGLNEFSTRLPSVLYGLITIALMYFVGKEFSSSNSKSFGLLTAFVIATMPWLIHYNRIGFEFSSYTAFFTLSVLLFIKATHRKSFIIPAFISASVTLYTYQSAKLLVPLLILGILFIFRKKYLVYKEYAVVGLLAFFILSIPLVLSFFNGQGFARFAMVSIFSTHLSLTKTAFLFLQNYFTQLSPSYFLIGEPTFITRHFTHGLLPLLMITLPFLFIGILYIFFTFSKKTSQLLVLWVFIYPLAGAVTAEAPFTSRSIIGAPLFAILISIGIIATVHYGKRFINSVLPTTIIIFLILVSSLFFLRFYFVSYPLYSSDFWGWQYGPKEIIHYFVQDEKKYDDLYMIGEFNAPEIFFKFYAPNDCSNCHIGTPDQNYNPGKKQLFAVTPEYLTKYLYYHFITKKRIYYPNHTLAFVVVEIVQ